MQTLRNLLILLLVSGGMIFLIEGHQTAMPDLPAQSLPGVPAVTVQEL